MILHTSGGTRTSISTQNPSFGLSNIGWRKKNFSSFLTKYIYHIWWVFKEFSKSSAVLLSSLIFYEKSSNNTKSWQWMAFNLVTYWLIPDTPENQNFDTRSITTSYSQEMLSYNTHHYITWLWEYFSFNKCATIFFRH